MLERLTQHWPTRYGLALASVVLPLTAALFYGESLGRDFYLTILFSYVLLVGLLGGLGPGLLATALAGLAGRFVPTNLLTTPDLRLLAAEGVLISIVSGVLVSVRRKSRERLEMNLRLERQILEIGDAERQRIGHDLHDGLGQHLTGISLLSETISQQLASGRSPDPQNVETITRLVSQAVQITRDLAKSLSPVTLERDGFVAALEELAGTSSGMFGIMCTCEFDSESLTVDRTRSLHLFRIVQEAVNNSVRHGKAKNVQIAVRHANSLLCVTVSDDGSGLSSKTMANPGLGLRIMQYRARMLGATLAVERSSHSGGTIIECSCPMDGEPGEG